jgi:hypothetical protein
MLRHIIKRFTLPIQNDDELPVIVRSTESPGAAGKLTGKDIPLREEAPVARAGLKIAVVGTCIREGLAAVTLGRDCAVDHYLWLSRADSELPALTGALTTRLWCISRRAM